ncbi:DUF3951 domain-containing protein [Aureibacillus halotolerans]|uniref:Uncharacterized protein DUF3951 n=1 Tax=Aureibacillus halotolerans TaxID=1508390 RepID=A0A4R6TS79_9BACI|nr:DUF3951 domain-containing protein [Aureibacillus halotolerans]TDQ33446.1 uncharacterized protein DUF3951 [Aureibacillus halotolerans]
MVAIAIITSIFTLMFCALIGFIVIKMMMKKEVPTNYYTPFDTITAQEREEFHEERQEIEEVDEDNHGEPNRHWQRDNDFLL